MPITSGARTPSCSRCRNTEIVLIRRGTFEDLSQIRRLEEQASGAAHWNSAQYEAIFIADATQRFVLVAQKDRHDPEIVGFLVASSLTYEWELENIVVDARHKSRGIGTALLHQLLSEAQAAGAAAIILEVRESNLPARRLYESIGFTSEGRRKAYYRDPVEDAILYRRRLQFCDKIP